MMRDFLVKLLQGLRFGRLTPPAASPPAPLTRKPVRQGKPPEHIRLNRGRTPRSGHRTF